MPQTDTEDRFLANELFDVYFRIGNRVGIARPIGKKNSIRPQRQHLARWHDRRHHAHLAARLGEIAQDVVFDAIVIGDDEIFWRGEAALAAALRNAAAIAPLVAAHELPHAFMPIVRLVAGDIFHQILADQAW